jgi:hypothetical protein
MLPVMSLRVLIYVVFIGAAAPAAAAPFVPESDSQVLSGCRSRRATPSCAGFAD